MTGATMLAVLLALATIGQGWRLPRQLRRLADFWWSGPPAGQRPP